MSKAVVNNFGKVTVSTGYDGSATSIVLTTGHGAKLPSTFSYYLVWWNTTDYTDPADDPNVEIVKVTARSTDTLTVTRGQDGTSASTKNTAGKTYRMILAPIKAIHDDLYNMMRETGCGRLSYTSTTVLTFAPYKGNVICINGQNETIPSAGVTFSNSGLVSDTTYYCYVYMSSGTMTGEVVVTGHSTDSSSGQEIKTGDATRTLVGMIRTNASSAIFEDSTTLRHVATWFNRKLVSATSTLSASTTTVSTTLAELHTSMRVSFLTWGDSTTRFASSGACQLNAAGLMGWQVTVDSLTTAAVCSGTGYAAVNGATLCTSSGVDSILSEGRHYSTMLVAVQTGTGTFQNTDSPTYGGAVRIMVLNYA